MPVSDQHQQTTAGQQLLGSLTSTTASRLQRHAQTTAAIQSKAKQSIPAAPKHPGTNDLSSSHAPAHEVQQLEVDIPRVQGNMQGIVAMLQHKAQRHEAAWARYQAARQQAEQQHNAAAAAAAAHSKAQLETVSAGIESVMAVLAADRVMVLDEQQLQEVWQCVEQRRGSLTACIDALAAGLSAAEEGLSQAVTGALQDMVAAMADIAHLDEGRIQRITEAETAALNMQVLENRHSASEVLQQLHANEVLQEQSRYKRWQAACEAWRTLRSKHAVACFCSRIQQELSEPQERLQLFEQLRCSQQAAHAQLVKLTQRMHHLGPPHLTSQAVSAWVADTKQWNDGWQQQLDAHLQDLQQHEQALEHQVQSDLDVLRGEVLGYKGLSEDQVQQLLDEEAQPVMHARQAAAAHLLQCAEVFMRRQAAEWQVAVQVLGSWLSSLVGLFESNKTNTAAAESSIKTSLRGAVQQFETDHAAREAALDEAVQLLGRSSDEKELDARLDAALQALSAIQAGYRAHAASAVARVRGYPGQVKGSSDVYNKCLWGLLHVQPQPQEQQPQQPAAAAAGHASKPASSGSKAGSAVLPHHQNTSSSRDAAGGNSSEYQQQQPQQDPLLHMPTGTAYRQLHDLWQALLDATPKPWLAQFNHKALQQQQGSAADQQPVEQAEDAAAAASSTAAAAAPAPKPAAGGGKMTKQQLAEAAAAEEAARAAAEAAAAAAEAEAAAYAAAVAQPPIPLSASGTELCLMLPTPDPTIQDGLQQLQVSVLQEAESFASRVQGTAETWAEQMETLLTEELDGRLRAHRPRAGRIEEGVRVVRSAELVAQRRRVDGHLRAQEKAVQQQQEQIDAAVLALRADAASWRAKLLDYERLLGNCLSSKGVDICWREAQALEVKLHKQLEQRRQQLQQLVAETCSSLAATSTAFEAEHLMSFADGGRYADASLSAHQVNLAALHTFVRQQQQQQEDKLAALHTELTNSLNEALSSIEALLPSHKQDMALVELLAQKVEGARRKAATALSNNTQAADSIDAALTELQACLAKAQPAAAAAATTVAAAKQLVSSSAGVEDAASGRAECQQLLECVDKLRQQMLRQAQVLDLLQQPTSIPSQPVTVTLPGELQPLSASPGQSSTASAARTSPRPASRAATPRAATPAGGKGNNSQSGGKGAAASGGKAAAGRGASGAGAKGVQGAANAAAAAAAAALAAAGGIPKAAKPDAPAVPLAKHITAIVQASKQEVEVAAKAYYAAKEPSRPIRFPAKIAPSLQELMSSVDGIMGGLGQMLQEHMAAAVKRLRVQVVQGYRLLERVPAAAASQLMQHLLLASADQRQQLLTGFVAQRQQLEAQLETHKHSLHPSMLSVARWSELEALKSAESSRQQAATALTATCAAACISLTSGHAQQLAAAATELARLLMCLFDGCVLPADLVPAPEGDDALAAGLQRLSLDELSRLAAAQDAAPPAGPAPLPEHHQQQHQQQQQQQQQQAGKGGGGGKPGASSAPGETQPGAAGGRPFSYVSWQLLQGDDVLSLPRLGWSAADQLLASAGKPEAAGGGGPPTTAAGAVGTATPAGSPLVGDLTHNWQDNGPAQLPCSCAAVAKPGAGTKPTPTAQPASAATEPAAASPVAVCGFDTVCNRAVVLAHRAAIEQVQATLASASRAALGILRMWGTQESQWSCAWDAMLQDIDTIP